MSKLQVHLDEPEHGWIGFTIREVDSGEILSDSASRIFDPFAPLVSALHAMLAGEMGPCLVMWLIEPTELEMIFRQKNNLIDLEINEYPDHLRLKWEEHHQFSGSYEEICLPFWRALRGLQGRYSEEELLERWKGYFPLRELDLLTSALKQSQQKP